MEVLKKIKKGLKIVALFLGRHLLNYRFIGVLIGILLTLIACNKDSNGDKPYEDPRYFGYMEAKVNGEYKSWGDSMALNRGNCDAFGCVYGCTLGVQSVYLYTLPDVPETIGIIFDVSEGWGCEELDAWYSISVGEENIGHYGSRDLCEDDDPFTQTTYICHDVKFTITNVGNNIFRGTFSFTASRNCGEEQVVITDGKFEFETKLPLCDYN